MVLWSTKVLSQDRTTNRLLAEEMIASLRSQSSISRHEAQDLSDDEVRRPCG
jgi:hypothetical protein